MKPLASLFVNTYHLQVTSVPVDRRLNYFKYLTSLYDHFRIASADVYSVESRNNQRFEQVLMNIGYRTHFSQFPDTRLREAVERTIGNVDVIIIAATDTLLAPVLERAKAAGTDVLFYMATTTPSLAKLGNYIPISEDLFYVRRQQPVQTQQVPAHRPSPEPMCADSPSKAPGPDVRGSDASGSTSDGEIPF